MLASLQRQLCLRLARCALQSQHNLLCRLRLLVEDGLRLTTVTGLFAIITTLSLREQGRLRDILLGGPIGGANQEAYLSGLVLCDFVLGVLSAVLALAVGASGLGYVDLLGSLVSFRFLQAWILSPSIPTRLRSPYLRRFTVSKRSFGMPKSSLVIIGDTSRCWGRGSNRLNR